MIVGMTILGVSPGDRVDRELDIAIKGEELWVGIRQPNNDTAAYAVLVPAKELREVLERLLGPAPQVKQ